MIYIHSSLPGNEAIVCNRFPAKGNPHLSLLVGRAHLAYTVAFRTTVVQGWRDQFDSLQSFLVQMDYETVYNLWTPSTRQYFGSPFQAMVTTFFLGQQQSTSPMSSLPKDIIFYILNMCQWDWACDTFPKLKQSQQTQHPSESHDSLTQENNCHNGRESGYGLDDSGNWISMIIHEDFFHVKSPMKQVITKKCHKR